MSDDTDQHQPTHLTPDASNSLARTARGTAALRACESERSDALFVDPLAALLAGEEHVAWVKGRPGDPGFWPVLRTRFLDDLLGDCMRTSEIRQIVLIAAGLDTRAYRLTWPAWPSIPPKSIACKLASGWPRWLSVGCGDTVSASSGVLRRCSMSLAAMASSPWKNCSTCLGLPRGRVCCLP